MLEKTNWKKLLLIIIGIVAILIIIVLFLWRSEQNKVEQLNQEIKIYKSLNQLPDYLSKWWLLGDFEKKLSTNKNLCEKYIGSMDNIHRDYLKCNPGFIECMLELNFSKTGASIIIDKIEFEIKKTNEKAYRLLTPQNNSSVEKPLYLFSLFAKKMPEAIYDIAFDPACKEMYLPQRIYGLKENKGKSFWLWDNFNRDFFIDAYPVTNREIKDWLEFAEFNSDYPKPMFELAPDSQLSHPAILLNPIEMQQYCRFHGKEVLPDYLYESASYYPRDELNVRPLTYQLSDYPWTRKNSLSFVENANKQLNYQMTKENCRMLYSLECKDIESLQYYDNASISWIGIRSILGGNFEYFESNRLDELNLKLSSMYFPLRNQNQKLGAFGYWDGEGLNPQNFSNNLISDQKITGIQFRCYREY